MQNMNRFKLWNNIAGWAVFVIATISYLLTMEPTASLWDCSEFIATSYKLEVGHPPGAPLFMMLARLASIFAPSVESVPVMINAMNCVASGLCILFLFWTITHLARRMTSRGEDEKGEMPLHRMVLILGAGVIGALSYAYTDTFWFSAVEGEVYAMSSMFTALVVWLMFKWEENAHRHTSMRWIILIAYLMGLSIGVHILNLLTIPALVMIWFFRRNELKTPKSYAIKMLLALVVSLLILGAINGLIIPYTVALGAAFDTFAVNSLGMPVNMGMLIFLLLIFTALGIIILYTHRKGYRVLNGVALAVAVILIGFSSYASVTIRAMANPPMNSNNPSTPHMLLSLLNRDQYGNRPLLYGPYYSALPMPVVANNPDYESDDEFIPTGDCVSKSMMWLNPETGEYEERVVFDGYSYPSEANRLLPRMWHYAKRSNYEEGWVALDGGHPTVCRTSDDGSVWFEPTAAEDIGYFLGYQMGDMFWRYFMWNFVGRQDDRQLQSDPENRIYLHGGWLSGIDFIDELYAGARTSLPTDMQNNAAHNTYFFLPLLLGLLGLVYQLNIDWRNFIVVMLLFVMMGIALVVYFNTAPDEPRERDYVYAGAFYAFCIWLGLGVMAIGDIFITLARKLKKHSSRTMVTAAVMSVLLASSVPTVLAVENWDDHDRSGRYMARDIGRNYLNSVPQNAIIINFGDNDTFPLWYCQEVEGVRPDVRVMNSSYLGGEWYIDEMKLAANDAAGVPFTIPSTKYSFVNDWVIVAPLVEVLDVEAARNLRAERRRIENRERYNIVYTDLFGEQKSITGSYYDITSQIHDAQDIIEEYQPIIEEFSASGDMQSDAFYDAYVVYAQAYDIFEAIIGDDDFMTDYEIMDRYWAFNDVLADKPMDLKDVIRLFTSDDSMTIVINDGMSHILGEGEIIPADMRKEDYAILGRLKAKVDSSVDGENSDYILSVPTYVIPVDREAAIASGIITDADQRDIVDEVRISLGDKRFVTKDHLMMLDLFAHFDWNRPLSFTQAHLMQDYGIVDYARFDGYAYTFVPVYTRYRSGAELGYLNADALYPFFMGDASVREPLHFGNLADDDVLVDYFYRYNISASRLRENFARVATEFLRRGTAEDVASAENLLDRGLEVLPSHKIEFSHSNTQPFLRGYYTIANYYLGLATEELEAAIAVFDDMLGMDTTIEHVGDNFLYFYELSDATAQLQATVMHRGMDASVADEYLLRSDDYFNHAEACYRKGDVLAAEYIKSRGEWVRYYLQYASYDSFSMRISDELYNAMLDIIETLDTSHLLAGSFDWVANGDAAEPLVEEALNFDALAQDYVAAISRITPSTYDENDPQMIVIERHICNIFEIYNSLPAVRATAEGENYASYINAAEQLLTSDAGYRVLEMYGMI